MTTSNGKRSPWRSDGRKPVSLYRQPRSPFWYYDIPDPRAPNGRLRRSTKRTSKVAAQRVARAMLREIEERDSAPARAEWTVEQVFARYLEHVAARRDAKNIRGRVDKLLGRLKSELAKPRGAPRRYHLDPKMQFHLLTTAHINRLWEARRREGNADQTINHEIKVLSAAYHLIQEEGGVRLPVGVKFKTESVRPALRYLKPAEEVRLLRELDPARVFVGRRRNMAGVEIKLNAAGQRQRQDIHDLAVALLDTGARCGEISTLLWADIDTADWRWISIYRSKNDTEADLAMTKRLRVVLQRRYEARGTSAYVFPGYGGRAGTGPRTTATQAIRRAIHRVGLNSPELVKRYGRATVHTFRHTFASRLVQAGVSLPKIQKLLGHADLRMTMRYSTLEQRSVAEEAAAVLDRIAAAK